MTIDPRHPLPGRRPLVVGAGRSGLAAARLLRRLGLDVRVCDARDAESVPETAAELRALGIDVRWGEDGPALLEGRDVVVWSPGIPVTHPLAVAARGAGVPVLSELELGYLAAHAPLVCITGTNGKSTTTDLVGTLVRATGREVEVCGNIGRAICDVAERVGPSGMLVVEVSSFQLETVQRLQPFIATWLNLTPDHLDRHGDLETYGATKRRLFERQGEDDWAVWNADDEAVTRHRAGAAGTLEFSAVREVDAGAHLDGEDLVLAWRGGRERVIASRDVRLPGPHNRLNVLAALATTLPLEIAPGALRDVLARYPGLEHRLEPVAEVEGVRFVNDSKATNVGSLEVALESFESPVILIAGGRDKGQDFRPLAALARRKVARSVLIGEGAARIAEAWPDVPHVHATSLEDAVAAAFRGATRPPVGERAATVVLLSPGCASFDMFRNFEDRGRRFKAEVERLRVEGVMS